MKTAIEFGTRRWPSQQARRHTLSCLAFTPPSPISTVAIASPKEQLLRGPHPSRSLKSGAFDFRLNRLHGCAEPPLAQPVLLDSGCRVGNCATHRKKRTASMSTRQWDEAFTQGEEIGRASCRDRA